MGKKSESLSLQFARPFNIEELGKSLTESGHEVLNTTYQKVESKWYHSDRDADLIIWEDTSGNIIKQQVNIYGQVAEWNIVEGLKTGYVVEIESAGNAKSATPVQIRYDRQISQASVEQAQELLKYIPHVVESDRKTLFSNFQTGQNLSSMDPREFVKKFGPAIKQKGIRPWFEKMRARMDELMDFLRGNHN